MAASNGTRTGFRTLLFVGAGLLGLVRLGAQAQDGAPDDLPMLRTQIAQAGVDNRDVRERAIERLLTMPRSAAHAVLHDVLRSENDPDQVRGAIVASLQRHLLLPPAQQFGGATGRVRETIVVDYLRALSRCWRPLRDRIDGPADDVRAGACLALQRMPLRELDDAARVVLASDDLDEQIDVMRCLADLQQTLFAATIAERLEARDEPVRLAARLAVRLLTCNHETLTTRAQFAAWQAANGSLRYIDLAERAARRGIAPADDTRAELERMRIDSAREIVKAHVTRAPGIDWTAVSARTMVDELAVLDACLELLQQALPALPDEASPSRATFCRELLARFRREPATETLRRARLLEVAAYLTRAEDGEIAAELNKELLARLAAADATSQLAAVRGLRKFPSPETRARLVAFAKALLGDPEAHDRVAAALATLSARGTPRWVAPAATDADRADWLALVAAASRSPSAELREVGLAVAQTLDASDKRLPETFDLLVELVRDTSLPAKFRATCSIHLQAWRSDPKVSAAWQQVLHDLLRDPAPELRQRAAESLAGVVEFVDSERTARIGATILALRDRLPVETEPAVVRAMVETMQVCGREPSMPEVAMGVLRYVLDNLKAAPPEQAFRIDLMLQALTTIAADPRADRGQWMGACDQLVHHRRRQSLRLILSSHAAVDLIRDVGSADAGLASRARQAVQYLIKAALLKPPRDAWHSTEELRAEARDVRAAFGALDTVEERDRLDNADHRLLRLEVELVAGKPLDVVQRATAWLANGAGAAWTEEQRDRVRVITAEAQLLLGRPDAARKLLEERGTSAADDAGVRELETKIARALAATDLAGAVEVLHRVWRRTAADDPAFRVRLVEWMQLRIRLDAGLREETLRIGEQHADLFKAADCPSEVREAWNAVRGSRS